MTENLATRIDMSDMIVDEFDRVPEIINVDSDSVMLDYEEIDRDSMLCLSDIDRENPRPFVGVPGITEETVKRHVQADNKVEKEPGYTGDKKEMPWNVAGLVKMFNLDVVNGGQKVIKGVKEKGVSTNDRKIIGSNVQRSVLSFTGFGMKGADSVRSGKVNDISKSKSNSNSTRKTSRGQRRIISTPKREGAQIFGNSGSKRKREKESVNECTGTLMGNSKYLAAEELVCRKRARVIQPTIEQYVRKFESGTLIGGRSDTADNSANRMGVVNPFDKQKN